MTTETVVTRRRHVDDGLPVCAKWQCQVCKRANASGKSKCTVCGTSRLYGRKRQSSKLDADNLKYVDYDDLDVSWEDAVGSGSFGSVHAAFSKTTASVFAVKRLDAFFDASAFARECELMQRLVHPRLVRCFDHRVEDGILVTEFLAGGELLSRLAKRGRYAEASARLATWQVLDAIAFMHSKKVAHCDIKLENILLKSRRNDVDVKICDFGLAKSFTTDDHCCCFEKEPEAVAATPEYAAPELLDENARSYGPAVDVWALGVVAFVLFTGEMPFSDDNHDVAGAFDRLTRHHVVSEDAQSFVQALLTVDPAQRPRAADARAHQWFLVALDDLANVENPKVLAGLRTIDAKRKLGALLRSRPPFHTTGESDKSSSSPNENNHGIQKGLLLRPLIAAPPSSPSKKKSADFKKRESLSLEAWLVSQDLQRDVDLAGWCETVDDLLEFDDALTLEFAAERQLDRRTLDRFRHAIRALHRTTPALSPTKSNSTSRFDTTVDHSSFLKHTRSHSTDL
mmetsp:Transcript_9144/g.28050  ORF Transcript_9144/g.28050 Transcript_9144/m.28050 type:complete len:512 (+) Transcript_9144:51-1586(+)